MSIFSDWHFCHVIQLSPQDTAGYLELMAILRSKSSKLGDIENSLEILGSTGTLQQAYALPVLLDLLLCRDDVAWYKGENESFQRKMLLNAARLVKDALHFSDTQADRPEGSSGDLCDLADRLPTLDSADLRSALNGIAIGDVTGSSVQYDSGSKLFQTYLETDKHAREIMILHILNRIGAEDPGIRNTVEKSQLALIEVACAGDLGALPQIIAMGFQCSCQNNFDSIKNYIPNDWMMYPEYMLLAARTVFANKSDLNEIINDIFFESHDFTFFQRQSYEIFESKNSIWFRTQTPAVDHANERDRKGKQEDQKLCAVLWQGVLWEYALKLDRQSARRHLETLWALPPASENLKYLSALYDQRKICWIAYALAKESGAHVVGYKKGKKGEEVELHNVSTAVCSPWVWCRQTGLDGDGAGKSGGDREGYPFFRYPQLRTDCGALRAFIAVCISKELFNDFADPGSGPAPLNILRQILNLGAALSLPSVKRNRNSFPSGHLWSGSLSGLGIYAGESLMAIGSGAVCPYLPGLLWEQFGKIVGKKTYKGNPQLQMIANREGMLACAHWAHYASVSGSVSMAGRDFPHWEEFEGPLCRYIFQKEDTAPDMYIRSDETAMWLYYSTGLYDEQRQFPVKDGNWYEKLYTYGDRKIDTYTLLRTRAPNMGEWEALELDRSLFTQDSWPVVLTMRVQSCLKNTESVSKWIEEWRNTLFRMKDIRHVPILFPMLTGLVNTVPISAGEPTCQGSEKEYDMILDTVIEIIDISVDEDNIGHLYRLADALANGARLFGPVTLVDRCSRLILSLKERAKEDPAWIDLQIYLIHRLAVTAGGSDSTKEISEHIRRYLDSICEARRKKHYVIREITNGANQLTDHYIHNRGEKIFTARQNVWLRGRNVINDFYGESTAENCGSADRIGVVYSGSDITRRSEIAINFGGIRPESMHITPGSLKNAADFSAGTLVIYKAREQTVALPVLNDPSNHSIFRVTLKNISVSGGVELGGVPFTGGRSRMADESVLSFWAPDTRRFENGVYPIDGRKNCYVTFNDMFKAYLPMEFDYPQLLVDRFYEDGIDTEVDLIYIGSDYIAGGDSALFSASPGFNYRLRSRDWEAESFTELRERLFTKENALGVKVRVKLCVQNDRPFLRVAGYDDANMQWAGLFDAGEIYDAEKSTVSGPYTIERAIGEKRYEISANIQGLISGGPVKVELDANGWSLTRQRTKTVSVKRCESRYIHIPRSESERYEKIRELLRLNAGDRTKLKKAFGSRGDTGYGTAFITDFQIRAKCSLESLTLIPGLMDRDGFTVDRDCIIENIYERRAAPQSAVGFSFDAPPECDELHGIIAEIIAASGRRSMAKAYVLDGERVHELDIPYSAFTVPPQDPGDAVTLTRANDGWTAAASLREIYVRALWVGQEHRNGDMTGTYLGDVKMPGRAKSMVTQDENAPVIHFWPCKTGNEDRQGLCGIPADKITARDRQALVVQKHLLFSNRAAFKNIFYRSVVCLELDGKSYWGEAVTGDFEKGSASWRVSIEVTQVDETMGLYDLRRRFQPKRSSGYTATDEKLKTLRESNFQWYKSWYEEGDWHLCGTIRNGQFHLEDHKLPPHIAGDITEEWLSDIPFAENDLLWYRVSNNRFPENALVRAKMTIQNETWAASCRSASPFVLNEALPEVFGVEPDETIKNYTLYCADIDENDTLRLEWGYGYTMLVSSEDIIDIENNIIGHILFFGDQITEFSIGKSGDAWKLRVSPNSIKRGAEYHVRYDSAVNNIIQLLKVSVSVETETVNIISVSRFEGQIGSEGRLLRSWYWQPFYNGMLDRDSEKLLLEEAKTAEASERAFEQYIFAQFIFDDGNKSMTRRSVFHYISLKNSRSLTGDLTGKRVCLTAGRIQSNYKKDSRTLGNDYLLTFYLPNERPLPARAASEQTDPGQKPTITVTVMRRNFSIDESKMRVYFDQDKCDAFLGHNMVVTLLNERRCDGPHEWTGSVLNTPTRSTESLVRWVESQSACIVSLGRTSYIDGSVASDDGPEAAGEFYSSTNTLIEVAPGIISKIPTEDITGEYHEGAIARLSVENGRLKAHVLMAGDYTYFNGTGRAVELLVMDDAAKQAMSPQAERKAKNDFTIASFPQVRFRSSLLERMMRRPWPRIGFVMQTANGWMLYEPDQVNKARAALIRIDAATNQPSLCYFDGKGEAHMTSWNVLSFIDSDSGSIAEAVKKSTWHYHDRCYALINEGGECEVRPLPSGNDYQSIVVFPDKNGRLRAKPQDLRKIGYSAREIIEYGLPKYRKVFPVAGADRNSIWIEFCPGRIVELPKTILFAGTYERDMSSMDVTLLSPGDEIALDDSSFSFKGGQRRLTVTGIKYSIRSLSLNGYMFLPVLEAIEGGLKLGCGNWHMTYPCADSSAVGGHRVVALTPENSIRTDLSPRKGNTVFVRMSGNQLFTETEPGFTAVIDRISANWGESQWLFEWLNDLATRKKFFSAMGNVVPMTVGDIAGKNTVYVYYSQPDENRVYPVGTILCCAALGLVERQNRQFMIPRAGRQLLQIPYIQLFPGFPEEHAEDIAECIREQQGCIWIHKTEQGWRGGVFDAPDNKKAEVYMEHYLEKAHGIICTRVDNMAFAWLPMKLASFVGIPAKMRTEREAQIWEALKKAASYDKNLSDKNDGPANGGTHILQKAWYTENGELSLIDADPANSALLHGIKRRAIPLVKIKEKPMPTYIAELYPKGNLIELYAECGTLTLGELQPIIISKRTEKAVMAVVEGSMHKRIMLSGQFCKYFDAAHVHSNTGMSAPAVQDGTGLFDIADKYSQMYSKALSSKSNASLDFGFEDINSPEMEIEVKLLYLLAYSKDDKKLFDQSFTRICGHLRHWLEKPQIHRLLGLPVKTNKPFLMVDICGIVTAILLLNNISWYYREKTIGQLAGKLSVHMVRMLGFACEASVHQEILMKHLNDQRHGGLFERINSLKLSGELSDGKSSPDYDGTLSQPQYERLVSTCKYITRRSMTGDTRLLLSAESLLHSVGQLDDYDSFEYHINKHCQLLYTWRLSKIGRALAARKSELTSNLYLSKEHFGEIKYIWEKICRNGFKSAYLFLGSCMESILSEMQKDSLKSLIESCMSQFTETSHALTSNKQKN